MRKLSFEIKFGKPEKVEGKDLDAVNENMCVLARVIERHTFMACRDEGYYEEYVRVLDMIQNYMGEGNLEAAKRIFGAMAMACDKDLMTLLDAYVYSDELSSHLFFGHLADYIADKRVIRWVMDAVPISYVYDDGKIFFHSAKSGHKIDAIKAHEKASFCVIDQDQIVPEEYTTYFRSVIAFGKMRLVEDENEIRRIATILAMKYSPGFEAGIPAEIDSSMKSMAIIEMDIEHMTAKEAIELVKGRKKHIPEQ